MRHFLITLIAVCLTLSASAQQKKTNVSRPKQATTARKQPAKTNRNTKTQAAKRNKPATPTTPTIKGLQNKRAEIQKKIRQQEQALRANQADVKKRLRDLMIINTEIGERKKNIDSIQKDIASIDGDIDILKSQLQTLEQQLTDRKQKYIKSMRYMARHRSVQDRLMFVFSAKNLAQMYRRLRFVREYANYQRAQGEMLKAKQRQVDEKQRQLEAVRGQKNNLLWQGKKEHAALQAKQGEQTKAVEGLQKQQKTIQSVIANQRKQDATLNAQIDRLVAEEVAKARARAAAEAKKKAEAAAEAKRKAAELERKKAEAAAQARENERKIAEAKAREERLKAEALAAAKAEEKAKQSNAGTDTRNAANERRVKAEQKAREAESDRRAVERKAKAETDRSNKEIAAAKKSVEATERLSTVDRMMTGGFEANKGRLPMPITGSYKIVSHYGQYNVEGLKNVTLDNKGINIMGSPGCMARSVYDGVVSAVFGYSGTWVVMVRHGSYISVYCNLKSASVSQGQKVSVRQALGAVGTDNILQFQLRKENSKLNPEAWLGR